MDSKYKSILIRAFRNSDECRYCKPPVVNYETALVWINKSVMNNYFNYGEKANCGYITTLLNKAMNGIPWFKSDKLISPNIINTFE